ncbi:MAG: matrixin family metalloprotease [Oscillospiraceae bacterium]|jgi:hypothetical protein|nr:matrixin family metalloprotease [Oscillospiraceae bacterium]
MKKKIVIIGLAIILLLSVCTQASAYSLWGYKWASKTIIYKHVSGTSSDSTTAFASGTIDFNSKTNVTLAVSSVTTATLYLTDFNATFVDWDGLTSITSSSGSYFSMVYCYLNTYYTAGYSTNMRRSVAAHELGHALGLGDLGTAFNALMNGYTPYRFTYWGVYTPQADDISGVNSIYP